MMKALSENEGREGTSLAPRAPLRGAEWSGGEGSRVRGEMR
jgi:hypothetical protein